LAAAFVLSAAAVPVLEMGRPLLSVFLVCAAIGMALGMTITVRGNADAPATGIPVDAIRHVSGVVLEDGRMLPGGRVRQRVRLDTVGDSRGVVASAGGTLVLTVANGVPLAWGTRVSAGASPRLAESGDVLVAYCDDADLRIAAHPDGILGARRLVRHRLLGSILSPRRESDGLFAALLLGVREDLGEREFELFRRSGTMHVLALSGMHLAILVSIVQLLLRPGLGKRLRFGVAAVLVVAYVFVVGVRPSLVRAAVMYLLAGAALLANRRTDPRAILLTCFVVLGVAWPETVVSLSFQLSFLALLGILSVGERLHTALRPYVPGFLLGPVCASVGAFVLTAPVAEGTFGALYPVGLLAGLVIAPMVTGFIWIGLAGMVAGMVGAFSAASTIGALQEWVYDAVVAVAAAAARVPEIAFAADAHRAVFFAACVAGVLLVYRSDVQAVIRELRFPKTDSRIPLAP
jgi:competence protein ComEC